MEKTKRIENGKSYDQTLTEYTVEEGVEEIGGWAFYECKNLKKVTIPRGVRRIRRSVFSGTGLTEVTLKEGVEEMGIHAFSYCSTLERVVLVKGIRKIGRYAFTGNKKLTELEIHEGVEEIGERIVAGTSLHTITLPLHPIPRFHDRAFQGTDYGAPLRSLTTLRLRGTYHAAPLSFPFPRITEEDNGQLVRFIEEQQAKYLRTEARISRNIYYALFIFKRRSHFLYRKDRGVGKKNPGPFSKRIMSYWFRGNWWSTGAYPIAGTLAFRESTVDYAISDDDDNETGEDTSSTSAAASSSSTRKRASDDRAGGSGGGVKRRR